MSMDEELNSLQLDKPKKGKTADQIMKHSLDSEFENKPVERSLYILTKGDDVQKLSVIQSLPQLIVIDSNATFTRIIPRIIQELPKASCEFHISTSRVFKILLEKQLPLNLLVPVMQGFESKDLMVANSWLDTLLAVIPTLTDVQIKRDVLPLAQNKAVNSKSVFYRVASCRMFGRICTHPKANTFDVKKTILPLVQSLCQDYNNDVRAAMCSQLASVAQVIGEDVLKTNLMPSVVELASDENVAVRAAAVLTVVMTIPYLSSDVKIHTIIPLVKKLCAQSTEEGDTTFTTVSREYGRILDALQKDLTTEDCVWFLQFYKSLSQRGFAGKSSQADPIEPSQDETMFQGVVCRQQCAYNLPALTLFTITHINSHLSLWYSVFRELAGDPCYLVRKTVAGCIHEIAKILGTQCKMIKQDIVRLLRDDAEEVLQMLVPNLGQTLELFNCYGLLSREAPSHTTLEIGRAILKCQMELSSGYNWRMQTHYMYQLEHLPNCMPSDFIHQHFTPVILNIAVQGRARPVRSQACRTLLVFLRYNIKEIQRKWVRDTLIARLCYADSCYTRHIYIRMCIHAMDLFSNKYFKDFFYIPLLGMADDRVSNIRLSVVSLIPYLKQMLMPEDRKLQQCLDTALSKLESGESNKDVMAIYRAKMREFKSLPDNANERMMEDRRRQEEENKISEGKPVAPTKRNPGKIPSFMGFENGVKPTTPQRPSSAPPHTAMQMKNVSSDMSFLEQHFYTDAGISLPSHEMTQNLNKSLVSYNPNETLEENLSSDMGNNNEQGVKLISDNTGESRNDGETTASENHDQIQEISTVSLENTNIETLSEHDLKKLECSTTNITDDVKVNLRRMKSTKIPSNTETQERCQKLMKRHSSIISASFFENSSARKASNRRSLNIAKDISRIPVSFSNTRSKSFLNINHCNSYEAPEISDTNQNSKQHSCSKKLQGANMSRGDKLGDNSDASKRTDNARKEVKPVPKKKSEQKMLDKNGKENIAKTSNLPVFIKRTLSESKK